MPGAARKDIPAGSRPRSGLRRPRVAPSRGKLARRVPRESPVEKQKKSRENQEDERGGFGPAGSSGQPGRSAERDVEEMAGDGQSFVAGIRLREDDHVGVVRHG